MWGKPWEENVEKSLTRDKSRDKSLTRDKSRDKSLTRDKSRDKSLTRDKSRDKSLPRDKSRDYQPIMEISAEDLRAAELDRQKGLYFKPTFETCSIITSGYYCFRRLAVWSDSDYIVIKYYL